MASFQTLHDEVKEITLNVLQQYTPLEIDTDEKLESSKLYIADEKLNEKLLFLQLKLDSELDESDVRKYGFQKIVNLLNPYSCATNYYIVIEKKWKQVNDPQKVRDRLDEEFEVWKNVYTKHALKELKGNDKLSAEDIKAHEQDIASNIREKKQKHEYIKENFSNLDVRICSKKRAHDYGTIHMTHLDKQKKRTKRHLSVKVPNVLYYIEPIESNKLDEYLMVAENIYGDVWVLKNS